MLYIYQASLLVDGLIDFCAAVSGRSKGKDVDWMDGRGEEIAMWQSMIDKPNTWVDGTLTLRPNMDKVE